MNLQPYILMFFILLMGCTYKGSKIDKTIANDKTKSIIKKRVAAKQNHIIYDLGASFIGDLSKLFQEYIIYPEIKDSSANKYIIPLLYRVSEEGNIYDIAIEKDFSYSIPSSYLLATSSEFELEAIRLLKLSGKWTPFSNKGAYVNREGRFLMHFEYHPEYFNDSTHNFVLNPDSKPKFNGNHKLYKDYTNPSNGSDGAVTFLAIIEKDGSISNEVCLQAVGKTNCRIGLSYLKKLIPWQPAIKDGNEVRTQIKITIATQ